VAAAPFLEGFTHSLEMVICEARTEMNKRNKSMTKAIIMVLANFSGIGMGIAFYEQKWPGLIGAVIAILIMLCLAWRAEDDSD